MAETPKAGNDDASAGETSRRQEYDAFEESLVSGDDLKLVTLNDKTIRNETDLDQTQISQLRYVIENCYWGDAKTIQDCFDWRHVDDGIMGYKEVTVMDGKNERVTFVYWYACFGGNQSGYLLRSSEKTEGAWETVIASCDGCFSWEGGGKEDNIPTKFVKLVEKTVMGDKYYSDED